MIIQCGECGGNRSTTAFACPHCGAPTQAAPGLVGQVGQPASPPVALVASAPSTPQLTGGAIAAICLEAMLGGLFALRGVWHFHERLSGRESPFRMFDYSAEVDDAAIAISSVPGVWLFLAGVTALVRPHRARAVLQPSVIANAVVVSLEILALVARQVSADSSSLPVAAGAGILGTAWWVLILTLPLRFVPKPPTTA